MLRLQTVGSIEEHICAVADAKKGLADLTITGAPTLHVILSAAGGCFECRHPILLYADLWLCRPAKDTSCTLLVPWIKV